MLPPHQADSSRNICTKGAKGISTRAKGTQPWLCTSGSVQQQKKLTVLLQRPRGQIHQQTCSLSCLLAQVSPRLCPDSSNGVHRHLREERTLGAENLGAHRGLGRVYKVWPTHGSARGITACKETERCACKFVYVCVSLPSYLSWAPVYICRCVFAH